MNNKDNRAAHPADVSVRDGLIPPTTLFVAKTPDPAPRAAARHPRTDASASDLNSVDDSNGLGVCGRNTTAIRTGHDRTAVGEHSEAIFETSSYVYGDSAESEAAFAGKNARNVYSRFTNPTVAIFEQRLASLERAEAAVATASGMAALFATFMTFLRGGDHILCSRSVFGSTTILLRDYVAKFGVSVDFVALADASAWEQAVRPQTRLLFCETPSNPLLEVADLYALAAIAGRAGALLVVDNTFCTPSGQNPLAFGAHIVIHSAGKYIDGQGRCIGGVAAGSFAHMERLRSFIRCSGPTLAAHNAWIFLKGLETLEIRMQRYSESAQIVAQWLTGHPRISRVHYTGLKTHPQQLLARRQQRHHGGVLSFTLHGGRAEAWRCIDGMRMISRTTNIGDTKSTVTHPASTTHLKIPPEDRVRAGITENLIRLTVGLEDVQDIVTDVERGLSAV